MDLSDLSRLRSPISVRLVSLALPELANLAARVTRPLDHAPGDGVRAVLMNHATWRLDFGTPSPTLCALLADLREITLVSGDVRLPLAVFLTHDGIGATRRAFKGAPEQDCVNAEKLAYALSWLRVPSQGVEER